MFQPTWNPFSRYADKQEKRVDKVLKKIAFLGIFEAQRKIAELMQTNLVVLDLWLEARFKGYKYLTRRNRKRMYRNTDEIGREFLEFAGKLQIDDAALTKSLTDLGLHKPETAPDNEKLRFIIAIMLFLRPGAGRYQYLEGASFGKLLNPKQMIGDCNQIVTFYTYLYSLKYDIKDLQIKLPPQHVCLHFKGIDIEATNGQFANYKEFSKILPIVELISTNLLDVSDFRDKQLDVHPRDFLKAAQLANNLSSERDLVSGNLKIAYRNVAIEVMKQDDYETALFFLKTAGINSPEDQQLRASILHNAILHHAKKGDFTKARYYLDASQDPELKTFVDESEAAHHFNNGNLQKARDLYQKTGNHQMIKATYGREYNLVQARVAGLRDLATMRGHRSDYQKMLDLAVKMEDSALADNVRGILKQL